MIEPSVTISKMHKSIIVLFLSLDIRNDVQGPCTVIMQKPTDQNAITFREILLDQEEFAPKYSLYYIMRLLLESLTFIPAFIYLCSCV